MGQDFLKEIKYVLFQSNFSKTNVKNVELCIWCINVIHRWKCYGAPVLCQMNAEFIDLSIWHISTAEIMNLKKIMYILIYYFIIDVWWMFTCNNDNTTHVVI